MPRIWCFLIPCLGNSKKFFFLHLKNIGMKSVFIPFVCDNVNEINRGSISLIRRMFLAYLYRLCDLAFPKIYNIVKRLPGISVNVFIYFL